MRSSFYNQSKRLYLQPMNPHSYFHRVKNTPVAQHRIPAQLGEKPNSVIFWRLANMTISLFYRKESQIDLSLALQSCTLRALWCGADKVDDEVRRRSLIR